MSWTRRKKWVVLLLAALVALGALAQHVAGRIIAGRLRSLVARQLNGELRMRGLSYYFPYRITIDEPVLLLGGGVEIFHAQRIKLTLAHLPLGGGPPEIEWVGLTEPVVNLDRLRALAQARSATPPNVWQALRLRRLSIDGGQLVAGGTPLSWPGLHLDVKIAHVAGDRYACDLAVTDTARLDAVARGTLDLDQGRWTVDQLSGSADVLPDDPGFPHMLTVLFQRLRAQGRMDFTGHAAGGEQIDYELTAQLRDMTLQPPQFLQPLEHVGGMLHLRNGVLAAQDITALCDGDRISLASCGVALLPDQVTLDGISGSIVFAPRSGAEPYPPPVGPIFAALRPSGKYLFSGRCAVSAGTAGDPTPQVIYSLRVACDQGALTPGRHALALTKIKMDLAVETDAVQVRRFEAACCGGRVQATGTVNTGPFAYTGRVEAWDVDVNELARQWAQGAGSAPVTVSGSGWMKAAVNGKGADGGRTAWDNLGAVGAFHIVHGDFWRAPVIANLLQGVKVAREALTAAEAAGTFQVRDAQIVLRQAAVNAPVLGLQGSGTIWFDGRIDASAVAAPMADWKEKLKATRIPLVSSAVADVAGAIQKLLNTATDTLLYEFRIRGTLAHPEVTTVPAPILTESAAHLFAGMLGKKENENLVDLLAPATQPSTGPVP